ncbi:2-dehydropantoate 2-reductase [Pelagerythrobacter sp.]|uniref:2-dehydropantoate 2-reductase n=1 Tax=Pelagerythrobacter sp. TaxID=2800702 RepID=UPI0035B3C5ED
MTRVAIIGPGAVGGTIAAWLANVGHDVRLCARTPFERVRLTHPAGVIDTALPVHTDPADASSVDVVISATKAYDSEAAAQWLPHLLDDHTILAVFQNGVEHREPFSHALEDTRLAPAVVDIPAEREAPGVIAQRRFGSITLADDAPGRSVAGLFADTPIETVLTDDLLTVAWRKLALNCAGIVNTITLKPAAIAHDPDAALAMRMLIAECAAVGRAEGANLPSSLIEEVIDHCRAAAPDSINSLHADRLAGRSMEVDARNGVIVRLGRLHGIPTPANELAIALLKSTV